MQNIFSRRVVTWFTVVLLLVGIINLPQLSGNYLVVRARAVVATVIYPAVFLTHATFDGVTGTLSRIVTLAAAQNENVELKKKLAEKEAELLLLKGVSLENQRLQAALQFYGNHPQRFKLLPAKVMARSGSNLYRTVLLNRGYQHGVIKNRAVISPQGLVGRVEEVFPYTSRVLLLVDPAFAVAVEDRLTSSFGVVYGEGLKSLSMQYVPILSHLAAGDTIVTSSQSDLFPYGIPVGIVRKVTKRDFDLFQKVVLEPAVDFGRLEPLFVVL